MRKEEKYYSVSQEQRPATVNCCVILISLWFRCFKELVVVSTITLLKCCTYLFYAGGENENKVHSSHWSIIANDSCSWIHRFQTAVDAVEFTGFRLRFLTRLLVLNTIGNFSSTYVLQERVIVNFILLQERSSAAVDFFKFSSMHLPLIFSNCHLLRLRSFDWTASGGCCQQAVGVNSQTNTCPLTWMPWYFGCTDPKLYI